MSAPQIARTYQAELDVFEIAAYIAEDNPDAGRRFLAAAEAAFLQIAQMPGIGRVRDFGHPELGGLRSWRVKGFKNYLVFYREMPQGPEVVRVLHGAQDLERFFTEADDESDQRR